MRTLSCKNIMNSKKLHVIILFLIIFFYITAAQEPALNSKEIETHDDLKVPDSEKVVEKKAGEPVPVKKEEDFGRKVERFFKVDPDPARDPSLRDLPKPYYVGLRSLAVPGWGQLKNKKYLKAISFFSLELTCALVFLHLDRVADERLNQHRDWVNRAVIAYELGHYEEYEKLRLLADDRYEKYIQNFLGMRNVINTALVIWLLCGVDAYVDAHLQRFMHAERLTLEIGMQGETPKISLCFKF